MTAETLRRVTRHYVDRRPADPTDTSRVLCVMAGDCKPEEPLPPGVRSGHGWTEDKGRVTCPRCLEWIHS